MASVMGEARLNGAMKLIDTSVSDRALSGARKQYVKYLSERLMTAMVTGNPPLPAVIGDNEYDQAKDVHHLAWKMAELHYEEMIRREADNQPPSITERLAADNIVSAAGMVA